MTNLTFSEFVQTLPMPMSKKDFDKAILAAFPFKGTGMDVVDFIVLAASLALQGDASEFARIPEITKPFENELEQLFLNRIKLEERNSRSCTAEEKAATKEKVAYFLQHSPVQIPEKTQLTLSQWVQG